MLNVNVNKKDNKVAITAGGNIIELCADLTQIIRALIQGMEEQDKGLAKTFKLLFLKGIDDGVVFGCAPEEIAKMRERIPTPEKQEASNGLLDELADVLCKLKDSLEGFDEAK